MSVLRRLIGVVGTWAAVLAVVGVAVHPERCPSVDSAMVQRAAKSAVAWFNANVDDNGQFLYRYDAATGSELGGYNDARHAGVMFSLYQAEAVGIVGAAGTADRALPYLDRHLNPVGNVGAVVFGRGSRVSTGASALMVIALDERRHATGDTSRDDDMRALAISLRATVTSRGAVDAVIDTDHGPLAGTRSPFATGQVMYALSRLHQRFPADGYGEAALRVLQYLVRERDDTEDQFPMLSDHWATYGLVTMLGWQSPPQHDQATQAWIQRQLGLFGVQVRYESQRIGGITSWTRGKVALPAGVGTVGEGLANLARVADAHRDLRVDDLALRTRLACVAGILVKRQTRSPESFPLADADKVQGAWFREAVTQMDDQQHPLSALLLAMPYLGSQPESS